MTLSFNINLNISRCTAVNPETGKRCPAFLVSREYKYKEHYNYDYDEVEYLFFDSYFDRAETDHPETVIEQLQLFLSEADFKAAPKITHAADFEKYQIIMGD